MDRHIDNKSRPQVISKEMALHHPTMKILKNIIKLLKNKKLMSHKQTILTNWLHFKFCSYQITTAATDRILKQRVLNENANNLMI